MHNQIKLSQCMIVKNEEKNIRQALSWAKDLAFEQIVVDTGSTDRTVKIAKEMGAKVFHFEWIDDFSAAKNYAIKQAKGDWISFLDADEYFSKEDAQKLGQLLQSLNKKNLNNPELHVIRCKWVHLDNQGIPFSVSVQDRIFRRLPGLRYYGRIHEQVALENNRALGILNRQDTLSILHTGYSQESYASTQKIERNISLLRKELAEHPKNYNVMSYLGDSLLASGLSKEALECFMNVIEQSETSPYLAKERFENAGVQALRIIADINDDKANQDLYAVATKLGYPNALNPDVYYYLGNWLLKNKKYKEALTELERGIQKLESYQGLATIMMTGDLNNVYWNMIIGARKAGSDSKAVSYCVTMLQANPYQERVLISLLSMLQNDPNSSLQAIWQFLGKLYKQDQLKDKLFVYKCAKVVSYYELEDLIYKTLSSEEQEWLDSRKSNPYLPEPEQITILYPDIICRNETDRKFISLMEEVQQKEEEELLETIKDGLDELKKNSLENFEKFQQYFLEWHFWGTLDLQKDDVEVLQRRAHVLKEHRKDFIWLYSRMTDYRSKQTLYAILDNWLHLHVDVLAKIKENGPDYFDLDILPGATQEVFVDVGASIGDTLLDYVDTYGEQYSRIYCYEITPASLDALRRNARGLHDVEIRGKAVSSIAGTTYVNKEASKTGNSLTETSEDINNEISCQVVSLDEDITEPIGLLKMNIEGAEQDAIEGCAKHIQREHPKLAISTYYGYEDIWKIPRMIDELHPDYHFYMRHYGGNLIPTEFVFFGV